MADGSCLLDVSIAAILASDRNRRDVFDADAAGERTDNLPPVRLLAVVDGLPRSESPRPLELGVRAGGDDHLRAQDPGDLPRLSLDRPDEISTYLMAFIGRGQGLRPGLAC